MPAARAASNVTPLPVVGAAFSLQPPTKNKSRYALRPSAGKPVLVMYWSTDCIVCKNKMPDIRREIAKLAGRFDVVLINTDRTWDTAEAYEAVLQKTSGSSTGGGVKPIRIWRGEPGFRDSVGAAVGTASRSPLTVVIGKTGQVAEVISGRIDDGVWQRIRRL